MNKKINNLERELINGCIRNDRISQKKLYEKYKNAMYTLCYRITGNHDDAHDALQEGFISIFRSIKTFRGESTPGSWIKTIIIRSAMKQLKHTLHTLQIEEAGETGEPVWPEEIDGEALEQAILKLPPKCRMVFVMVEVEGYAHKEVAEMTNISEGTSKSQLSYAKKLLREKLVNGF